MFVIG